MGLSSYVARRVAEERTRDMQREAEQIRLIRAVKGSSRNAITQWVAALFAISAVAAAAIILQIG